MVVDRLAALLAVLRCAFREATLVWMVMAMMKLLGVRKSVLPIARSPSAPGHRPHPKPVEFVIDRYNKNFRKFGF